MKNIILTILFCFAFYGVFSQCTTVPVEEAVRNGDFEKGYVNGSGTAYTNGSGAVDFTHSFTWPYAYSGNNTPCIWGAANTAGVARNQKHKCGYGPYIGYKYYGNATFKDHTPGKNGNGFALILDMVGAQTKTAWKQTNPVYSHQKYYFSSWFAKYTAGGWVGKLRFYVKGNVTGTRELVSSANVNAGLLQWKQFNGTWDSGNNTSATLEIVFIGSGIPNSDDFVIDDISFINSCQNISSQVAYTVDFPKDEVNFCDVGGEYVAQVRKNNGNNLSSSGKSITWYKGASDPQTEIPSWANNPSPTITEPGTYRVCVVDAANSGCTVGSTVVTKEELNINVSDYVLCNPATEDIDLGLTVPNDAYNLDWTGPSGNVFNSSKYTVSDAGNHSVTATAINGYNGCSASDSFLVTSNLPQSQTITYCEGGGKEDTLKIPGAKKYNWSTSKDMKNIIGNDSAFKYTPPNGSIDTIKLWVQNSETSPMGVGGSASFGNYPAGKHNLSFKVTEYVKLQKFDVWGQTWIGGCGGSGSSNYTFTLTGPNNVTHKQNVKCTGKTTINIDALLPPGNYVLKANKPLKFSNTTTRRNLGGGKVVINTTGKSMFGNLNFRSSNACEPIPIVLVPVSCCAAPTDIPAIDVSSSTLEVCSPDNGEVISVSGLTNGLDFKWQESSDGTTWTDISGQTGDVTGGKITLSDLSVNNQWYKYILAEDGNLDKACVKTSDSVQLVIKPKPIIDSISLFPNQTTFCEGEAYKLEAHVDETSGYPVTYLWKQDGSGTDSTTNGLTLAGSPTYEVVVDADGCLDTLTQSVTVSSFEVADVTDNQGDFCINDSPNPILTYESGTLIGGRWSLESSNNATIDSSSGELSLTDSGSVKAYYQTPGLCFGIDSVDFNLQPAMEAQLLTDDTSFCKIDATFSLRLTTNSNSGGVWTTWDVNNSKIINAMDSNGVFNTLGLDTGDYKVKYIVDGFNSACSDSDSLTITILDVDIAELNSFSSVCSGDSPFNFTYSSNTTPNGTWSGNIGLDPITGEFTPSTVGTGIHNVIYQTQGACPSSDTTQIFVKQVPLIDSIAIIPHKTVFCEKEPYDLVAHVSANPSVYTKIIKFNDYPGSTVWGAPYAQINVNGSGIGIVYYGQSGLPTIGSGKWMASAMVDKINSNNALGFTDFSAVLLDDFCGSCIAISNLNSSFSGSDNVTFDDNYFAADAIEFYNQSSTQYPLVYTWKQDGSGNDSILKGKTSSGSYIYELKVDAIGCLDSMELSVDVAPSDSVIITNSPSLCTSSGIYQLTLDSTKAISGVWSGNGVDSLTGQFDPSGLTNGKYQIVFISDGLCSDTVVDTVTITDQIIYEFPNGDTSFCLNHIPDTVAIPVNTGGGKFWTTSGVGIPANTDSMSVVISSYTSAQTDSLYYGKAGQCGDTVGIELTLLPVGIAEIDSVLPICSDTSSFNFTYSSATTTGGEWSGPGIIDGALGTFDPNTSGPGIHTIKYTTPGNCPASDSVQIIVRPRISVSIDSLQLAFCGVANEQTAVATPNTIGGVTIGRWEKSSSWPSDWDSGLSFDNDSTLKFNPTGRQTVTDTIFYIVDDNIAVCGSRDTLRIGISNMEVAEIDSVLPICSDTSSFNFTYSSATTAGGVWSGPGIIDGALGTFDPDTSGPGIHTIKYTTPGVCFVSDSVQIIVRPRISVSIDSLQLAFCGVASEQMAVATPNKVGGVTIGRWEKSSSWPSDWDSGLSFDNDSTLKFNPTGRQAVTDTIFYIVDDNIAVCGARDTLRIGISNMEVAEIDSVLPICSDTSSFNFTYSSATTVGGVWSGPGIIDGALGTFDPSTSGPGIHTIRYKTPGVCFVSDSVQIIVRPRISVSIDSLQLAFCGVASEQMAVATPNNIGGVTIGRWEKSSSWPSDWDSGLSFDNDSTLKFNPTGRQSGTDTIFYIVDDNIAVCGAIDTLRIGISSMEIAKIDTLSFNQMCSDEGATTFALMPTSTSGGKWSGPGIIDESLGVFRADSAGVGTHMIKYTTPGVCFATDSHTITALLKDTLTLTGKQVYCGDTLPDSIFANKSGGVFFGGWNTVALTSVNDSTSTFDPVKLNQTGVDVINYGIAGQCGDTASLSITVKAVDVSDIDGSNASALCQTDNAVTVSLMSTATPGGFWTDSTGVNIGTYVNASGLFDPGIGEGVYKVFYTTPGACFTTDSHFISVVPELIVDIDTVDKKLKYCSSDGDVDLNQFLSGLTTTKDSLWEITQDVSNPVDVSSSIKDKNKLEISSLPSYKYDTRYILKYSLGNDSSNCRDTGIVFITIVPVLDPTITPLPSSDTCNTEGTLAFTNTGDNGGKWSVDNGGIIDSTTGVMTLKSESIGSYSITYSLGSYCPIDSTVKLEVDSPFNPKIVDPGKICAYDPVFDLTAEVDTGGVWSGPGIINDSVFNPKVNGNNGGVYPIKYSFSGVCPVDSTLNFVVDTVYDPTITNEPSSNVCITSGPYTFQGIDAGGRWSVNNGGVIDSITGEMDLDSTGGGDFTVVYTHSGCFISDTVSITIDTVGIPDITAMGPFCENEPVQSHDTLPLTPGGVWSSTPVSGVIDPSTGEFYPALAGPGLHLIRYELFGTCPVWDTTTVIVNDLPDNWSTGPRGLVGCEPFTAKLGIESDGSLPLTTRWISSSLDTITNGLDSLNNTFVNDGVYTVYSWVEFENGCLDTGSVQVRVDPIPEPDFDWSPKNTTVLEPFIQFENISKAVYDDTEYLWDLGRSIDKRIPYPATSTEVNPSATYPDPDSSSYWISLTATNQGGCTNKVVRRIWILDNFSVYTPNAFTPDGNGLNDVFFPKGKNHNNIEGSFEYHFMIFNRWGQMVWDSKTPYQPWDGTELKTSNKLQEDVYVWKLKVWDNVESTLKTHYGRVSLLR